nr:hypothetical protein [Shigella flexneri]
MSINIDGRDCCQTGQFSQDVADGALTHGTNIFGEKLVTGSWSAQRVSNQCS